MDDLVRDFPITNLRIPSFARGIKILLVDEDFSTLFNISSMLEDFSFKVTTVEQTSVAWSMIRNQKKNFRLVIANVNMPDMNNLSFLHEIMKKIPVILMSSDSSIAERAICEGASFFIQKPVAPKNLKSVWQHVDWNREEQNKKKYRVTNEDRGGNQMGSLGTKINETSTLSRLLMEGNITKEASGTIRPHSGGIIIKEAGNTLWPSTNLPKPIESGFFSIPNTECKYHGNLFTDPLSQRMQSKEIFFIIMDDENDHLQNTKASKKQEGSNLKRQLSEKKGKKQVKKTKTNLEIINSGGSAIKGKGKKEVGGDDNISIKKTWRSAWNPELHRKFTEAINAVGDENVIPRTIEVEMNAPGMTRKQQIDGHQQKHEADRKRINETGTRSLPSIRQLPSCSHAITASISQPPSCAHAITAFAPPLKGQNQLISQHGQGDLNFGVSGTTTQSINTKPLTQPEKYGAELPWVSEAGTTNLPSLSEPYCKHARTTFSSPLERQSSLHTEHGLQNFNFGVAGNAQSTIPEQERRPGVHRINETGRSLPFISQSSCSYARTSFSPPLKRQSSLISQHGQGSVGFGDASNMQSNVQKPPTQPEAIVGSFISHGRRMPRQYTGQVGLSSNLKLNHKHIPNEVHSETHGVLQNLNQKRKTSSNGMTDKGKGKQPLGFEENRTQTARTNLPNVIFEISRPPSLFGSAGTQASALNLPNLSSSPPRMACPYVSAGTQAFEMNLNSSGASPRASSLYVTDGSQVSEGNRTQTTRMNLPNAIFEISTPPSPYGSSGTQLSALNLPNLSSAPQREAFPYMSAGNQVSEMNLPNSSGAPPRAPSLYVADGTQVSEVNLPNSNYMPPSAAPSYVQFNTQGSEVNLPYLGFAPPRAPFANTVASTQGCEMSLLNSNYVPSAYVATGTQLSETNVPNSSYASPEVPSPYVSTGIQVSGMSPSPSPYVSTGIQVSGMSPSSSSYVPPMTPSPSASASMFQLPNSADYFQQNQDLASVYNSEYQNQLSMGATGTEVLNSVLPKMTLGKTGVSRKDKVLDSAPATITSSNATNPQELQTNFSHPTMNQAAAADSPNHYQFLSEYEDILRILDEDAANFEDFSYSPNLDEKCFQWLQKNMKGKNTDPF